MLYANALVKGFDVFGNCQQYICHQLGDVARQHLRCSTFEHTKKPPRPLPLKEPPGKIDKRPIYCLHHSSSVWAHWASWIDFANKNDNPKSAIDTCVNRSRQEPEQGCRHGAEVRHQREWIDVAPFRVVGNRHGNFLHDLSRRCREGSFDGRMYGALVLLPSRTLHQAVVQKTFLIQAVQESREAMFGYASGVGQRQQGFLVLR